MKITLFVFAALPVLVISYLNHRKTIHKTYPSFLKSLDEEKQREYHNIASNPGLSIYQINEKLKKWTDKNRVKEQFDEFLRNFTETQIEMSKQLGEVVQSLQTLKVKFDNALKDDNKTMTQQRDEIETIGTDNEKVMSMLHYIADQIGYEYYADEINPINYYPKTKYTWSKTGTTFDYDG